VEKLADGLWDYLFRIIPWQKIAEDYVSFDSSVYTRYGEQQGAKKGYNPTKPGRRSHHPILAFLGNSRYIPNMWNRAGNARSSENVIDFAKQTCQRLQGKLKIKGVLADAGFYDIDFIKYLEAEKRKYVIAAAFYRTLQEKILSLENWHKVDDGIEMAEFYFCHKAQDWDKPRRYFAVRRRRSEDKPEPVGKQLTLFPELEEVKNYRYSAYITSFTGEVVDLWRIYRRRGDDENRIKEIKYDFGIDSYNVNNFYATEAAMLMLTFLYNLFNLFRSEILPKKESRKRASTIRFKYFATPAILGASGNQEILRLGIGSRKQRCKFTYALHQVSRWFPPDEAQLQCI